MHILPIDPPKRCPAIIIRKRQAGIAEQACHNLCTAAGKPGLRCIGPAGGANLGDATCNITEGFRLRIGAKMPESLG